MSEIVNAILKGIGHRPTANLLRWSPAFTNPFRFDLLEVFKCEADGGIVTVKIAQSPLGLHAGHRVKTPQMYSFWEWLKVQLRLVR